MAEKERDRPDDALPDGPTTNEVASTATRVSVAVDADRLAARKRLREQEAHIRVCTELDRLAPLSRYYSRPLRNVPLGTFLLEGSWVA